MPPHPHHSSTSIIYSTNTTDVIDIESDIIILLSCLQTAGDGGGYRLRFAFESINPKPSPTIASYAAGEF
jgi:hypothetical protein